MNMYTEYVAEVKATLDALPWQQIQEVVDVIINAWRKGQQIFVMGNGGSASTASHMACDLSKNTANAYSPRLRVMSLNDNMALLSAHSNDNGYENVFAEQLKNFINRGDVVIAISASGNSANVLKAIRLANAVGATTIGWSGYEGGQLAKLVEVPVVVPNHNIEQIEDIHLMLEHMVTVAVREAMAAQPLVNPHNLPFTEAVAISSHLPMPAQSAAD
jgi:D-sedoheptulose 7-phosphate isomerase